MRFFSCILLKIDGRGGDRYSNLKKLNGSLSHNSARLGFPSLHIQSWLIFVFSLSDVCPHLKFFEDGGHFSGKLGLAFYCGMQF